MVENTTIEAQTLTEDIADYNRKLDVLIGKLEQWKMELLDVQSKFAEKFHFYVPKHLSLI